MISIVDSTGGVVNTIIPTEPTVAITVVASAMMVAVVAFMAALAVAPYVSERWGSELGEGTVHHGSGVDSLEAD